MPRASGFSKKSGCAQNPIRRMNPALLAEKAEAALVVTTKR
jgi:hypothetical protein